VIYNQVLSGGSESYKADFPIPRGVINYLPLSRLTQIYKSKKGSKNLLKAKRRTPVPFLTFRGEKRRRKKNEVSWLDYLPGYSTGSA
jgi:hypothetical protein